MFYGLALRTLCSHFHIISMVLHNVLCALHSHFHSPYLSILRVKRLYNVVRAAHWCRRLEVMSQGITSIPQAGANVLVRLRAPEKRSEARIFLGSCRL